MYEPNYIEVSQLEHLDTLIAELQSIETTEDGRETLSSEQAGITGNDR